MQLADGFLSFGTDALQRIERVLIFGLQKTEATEQQGDGARFAGGEHADLRRAGIDAAGGPAISLPVSGPLPVGTPRTSDGWETSSDDPPEEI